MPPPGRRWHDDAERRPVRQEGGTVGQGLEDARKRLDDEYGQVRRRLDKVRQALDRVEQAGPEDDP